MWQLIVEYLLINSLFDEEILADVAQTLSHTPSSEMMPILANLLGSEDDALRIIQEVTVHAQEEHEEQAEQEETPYGEKDFDKRLKAANIAIVGADYSTRPSRLSGPEADPERWCPVADGGNYIGIQSLLKNDYVLNCPFKDFGDWSTPNYWTRVSEILNGKVFDRIFIDRGTFHHMLGGGLDDFRNTSFFRFIQMVLDSGITHRISVPVDTFNVAAYEERSSEGTNRCLFSTSADFQIRQAWESHNKRVTMRREICKFFNKHFSHEQTQEDIAGLKFETYGRRR